MKKAMLIIIASILLALAGCADPSLPVYDMSGNLDEPEELYVTINGAKYSMIPESLWTIHPGTEVIGYAGSTSIQIIEAADDTARNFVFLNDLSQSGFEKQLAILHRTDIPDPSASVINKLEYYEQDFREDEIIRKSNVVTDQEIIDDLFHAIESGEPSGFPNLNDFSIMISCFSDKVPGAVYILSISASNKQLVCGTSDIGYFKVSKELLEKIAGHEIDINEMAG